MARAPTISVKELSQRGQIRLSFSVRNHSFWHAWQNTTSLPPAAPRWLPPEDAMVGGGRAGWLLRKAARAPSRPVATAIASRPRDATVPRCGGKDDRVGSRGVQRRSACFKLGTGSACRSNGQRRSTDGKSRGYMSAPLWRGNLASPKVDAAAGAGGYPL